MSVIMVTQTTSKISFALDSLKNETPTHRLLSGYLKKKREIKVQIFIILEKNPRNIAFSEYTKAEVSRPVV